MLSVPTDGRRASRNTMMATTWCSLTSTEQLVMPAIKLRNAVNPVVYRLLVGSGSSEHTRSLRD